MDVLLSESLYRHLGTPGAGREDRETTVSDREKMVATLTNKNNSFSEQQRRDAQPLSYQVLHLRCK
jgi:hypothetical protein